MLAEHEGQAVGEGRLAEMARLPVARIGRYVTQLQDLVNIAGKRNSLLSLNHQLNSIPGVLDGAFYMQDESSHDAVTRLAACIVAPGLTADAVFAALLEHTGVDTRRRTVMELGVSLYRWFCKFVKWRAWK